MGEVFESRIDRINRESAERRANGDFVEDPRVTARNKAREYIKQAEAFSVRALEGDAEWVTAYSTLALATLAFSETTIP